VDVRLRVRAVASRCAPRARRCLRGCAQAAAAGTAHAPPQLCCRTAGGRQQPLAGYGLVVPRGEGLRTAACSFFSTKFPGRAPEGHVLLRGFVGGARDPEILQLGDAALAALVRREMCPVLGLGGEPVLTRVYRWPQGTPQMEVGHFERVAEIERHAASVPGP
jgi:protoporphyrinogen oxidase